ncbi:MAG: biotin-dependent carboxyltransferase family protein [Methylocystis sp.]|nr:biotin-dependent carboxyltransferase family protein [Methylocystis sp.]MBI3274392.1 biotin-dependent carboxyltransferase family protein [Methylocystis sp.]
MSARLLVRSAGPGVTLQDAGRRGHLRFGVTPAGPMDAGAFAAATVAAGARPDVAAIEVSLGGVELEAQGEAISVAIAGGAFEVRCDGRKLPSACALRLEQGARLSVRPGPAGAWCYIAVGGCFDLPKVLGSLATHTRSQLGGLDGRALRAGDVLPIAHLSTAPASPQQILAPWLARPDAPVRVVLGPQDDYFTSRAIKSFLATTWRVSARSDRMAYGLEGATLEHGKGHDIVSDGVALGAIQVPGDGRPLVLMADRQPTGGYPKIANVIGADIGAVAQLRPGQSLSFAAVSIEEATAARRALRETIAKGAQLVAAPGDLSSEFLLSQNLIGGVSDAGGG